MLKLPVFQPAEIDAPAQMFRCEFYKATIAAGICIARQRHRYRVRLGGGKQSEERISGQFQHCASGECDQGNTIAEQLEDYPPSAPEDAKDRKRAAATKAGKAHVAAIEERLAQKPGWPEFQARKEAERQTVVQDPAPPPMKCKADGCSTALRVNNTTNLCQMHRQKVPSRKRKDLVPQVARAAATAGNALDSEPAPPAEETRVAEAIEEKQVCAGCGKSVRRGRDGKVPEKCFRCRLKAGEVSDHKGKPPRKAKKPRTLADVARKHGAPLIADAPYRGPVKTDDDVLVLLQQKRQQHLDQVERLDKAIEALG